MHGIPGLSSDWNVCDQTCPSSVQILAKILIFQLNQEFPDLVYFSREIGPNSVWILAKNPDFFNKIRSFQVPLTVSYTEPSIPSCVGGGGTKIYLFLSRISAMDNFHTFRLELFSIRTLNTQVWGVGTKIIWFCVLRIGQLDVLVAILKPSTHDPGGGEPK